jgi:2-amino-4-hydroxy-6-hydroxymethyldihydropteridine diphosphokinase
VTHPVPAVLSLGSNLGDREQNLRDAVAALAALDHVTLTRVSGIVETAAVKPEGVDESAPAYLNAVALLVTSLDADALLARLNQIEADLGRVREVRWGDRTLDIDIVTFGDVRRADDILVLPHPRASERSFVLVPWLEVDPDAVLPGVGRVDGLPAAREDVARYRAEDLS